MTYIAIFLALLILVCFLRIKLGIRYLKDKNNNKIIIFAFNEKFKLMEKISFKEFNNFNLFIEGKKYINKNKISTEDDYFRLDQIYENVKFIKDFYLDKFLNIKDHIIFENIDFNMEIGTGDAFFTGILSGVLWSLGGIIISYFCNNFKVSKKNINVKTNFKNKSLNFDLYCIFSMKVVYIIIIIFKILLHYIKVKVLKQIKLRKVIFNE